MHIAVEGCSHGELEIIYSCITRLQETSGMKIDLLICCGDFQSVRNLGDLKCMAVPTKYMKMQSFYKYYSGEAVAPVLTIFIGGNHEASNYLQELPYGGWVAPNIYYLGYGGVVNVGGLRIGGLSGIYKGPDYLKGRYEIAPYTDSSIRSVYHVRNLDVFRAKQLSSTYENPVDIFLSHDWPRGVTNYGNAERLCQQKSFFTEEVKSDTLGSRAAQELLHSVKPRYWFSGHLHVKFAALVKHQNEQPNNEENQRFTRFLALDKCLPRREFLQVIEISPNQRSIIRDNGTSNYKIKLHGDYSGDVYDAENNVNIYHDLEWLTILRLTNHLLKVTPNTVYMPGPGGSERYSFTPTKEELDETFNLLNKDLLIKPECFSRTVDPYNPVMDEELAQRIGLVPQPSPVLNPYTTDLCEKLSIDDPVSILASGGNGKKSIMMTPKRQPTAEEMNVTLNSVSKRSSGDEGPPSDDEPSDIVFDVTINSCSEGGSYGTLSPATCQTLSRARKSLKLDSPKQSDSGSSPFNLSQDESSTADSGVTDSAPSDSLEESSQDPSTEEEEMAPPRRSLSSSLRLSAPIACVMDEVDASDDLLTDEAQTSPKRPLEAEPTVAEVKDDEDEALPRKKPSKIVRRNASVYSTEIDS